jgi:exopolysaccharide production protein ExoQ
MIYIASLFYMVMATGAFAYIDRMIYGDWFGKSGDELTEALNLLAIVVSLLLCWWGAHRRRSARFNRVLPLAAASLLVTSVLWSVAPSTTATRSIAYFFLVVGAIGMVEIFDTQQLMRLTALIGGLLAAVSLVLQDNPLPAKNSLGEVMAIGVLGALHCIRVGGRRRFRYIGVTVLCTAVALWNRSATSLLTISAFFILHVIGAFYIKSSSHRMISIGLTIIFVAIFIPLMHNIDWIYSLLDKDPTLSGRTDFWPYIIDYVYQRPLLGWGFAAFWMPSNLSAAEVNLNVGFGINEAHNGLLQLLLDIGVVGTAFFLFVWMRNLVLAVKCINGPAPEIGVSSLLLLVGILMIGVSEQVLTIADELTAQFFLLGFMCEKELWVARRARPFVALRSGALRLGQLGRPRGEHAV